MAQGIFAGKTALITGASSGIGEALAREFARQGASLILCARRVDRLEKLAHELGATGMQAVACDVTHDGELERVVEQALARFGRVDVVVANAGFTVGKPVRDLALEDFRRQFETNVFGVLRTVKATLPALERSRGTLALMGSVAGYVSGPETSPYCMSKFAVRALAEALDGELAKTGVCVTHIAPGFVKSEIHQVDNRGVYRADKKAAVPDWIQMPTDKAARIMVRAIARRKPEVVITAHGKLVVWLTRFLPGLMRRLKRRIA